MKTKILDTLNIKSIEEIHEQLAKILGFPKHYGKNLDALYDCLSTELELPLKLVWKNYTAALKNAGKQTEKILETLKEFSEEEPEFVLEKE